MPMYLSFGRHLAPCREKAKNHFWRATMIMFVFSSAAFLAGCASKVHVRPLIPGTDPNTSAEGGVFYALPRTVLTATAVVSKTKVEGGEYCACAEQALPEYPAQETADACKEAKLAYKVESIVLGTRGEPDPDHVYEIDISTGTFEDKTFNLQFTDDGILTHGEAQSTNHTVEFVTTAIGSLAKIAASVLTPKAVKPQCDSTQLAEANKVSERIRDMTRARDRILQDTSSAKETLDVLQARLKPYNDQIKGDLEDYFFGKSSSSTLWTGQFETTPSTDGAFTLFQYNPEEGICANKQTSGVTVLNPFDGNGTKENSGISASCPNPIAVNINLTHADKSSAATVNPPKDAPKDKTGFFYRIPATAFISASEVVPTRKKDGTVVTPAETSTRYLAGMRAGIAQFGKTVWLPITTGGRRTQYTFDLIGTSGGMKTFTVASDAVLDKSVASDLATDATAVIDAKKAKDKQEADNKTTDLDELKKQGDILEQQKRIIELQKEIDDLQKPAATENQ